MLTRKVDMLSGPITKGLLSMTIPIMVMNVMQSLFSIIDMTALRFFSDDNAVGAVGACGALFALCTSLLIGLSTGANVIVAKRIGAGEKERADSAVMTAVLLAAAGGLVLMVIGLVFAQDLLKMMNCHESLLRQATVYFRIYFLGIPPLMVYNFCASIIHAAGDTRRPMYFLIFGGLFKVVLSIFLLSAFDVDVGGVAAATVISNLTVCFLGLRALFHVQNGVKYNVKGSKFNFAELKDILFIGVPAGIQGALYSFANVVISTAVNGFGAAATTGISIANQFDGILYQIVTATSYAAAPYIAQNAGAGNLERIRKTIARAVLITTGFGAVIGALAAGFSGQLSSIMTSDPQIIAFSQQKMIIVSSTYFICGINDVLFGALRGLGRPMVATGTAFVFMCALRFVWVYVFFPHCPNLTFLYAVWPVGWALSILTQMLFYYRTMAALEKKQRAATCV